MAIDPAHCCHCWSTALFHAVHDGRLKEAEDLCKAPAVLNGGSEGRRGLAASVSAALTLGNCLAMAPDLVQYMSTCLPGEWDLSHGMEAHLLNIALNRRREDVVLQLLRACPNEWRHTQACKAFALACVSALPEVVRALLPSPTAAASKQQLSHEWDNVSDLPQIDPWMLQTVEEGEWTFESALPLKLALSNDSNAEALLVVDMLVHAMGPTRAVNHIDQKSGMSVTHTAVKFGRLDIVRLLFEKYGTPPPVSPHPVLFTAVMRGHLPVLHYLITVRGMPVEAHFGLNVQFEGATCRSFTPLLIAAVSTELEEEKQLPMVRWLVEEAGADTNARDEQGRTAAELARLARTFEVERYFRRDEKEAQANAAASALLAELQQEEDKTQEERRKKKDKKARKKDKKRNEEAERERKRQREEDEQKKREKQEQDKRARERQAQKLQERHEKEEEERARKAVVQAAMKELGHDAGFFCLLSGGVLMTDPCIASVGYSYERRALEAYIARAKATGAPLLSPTTGQVMGDFYVRNHHLRSQLQAWLEEEKKGRGRGEEEGKIGDEIEEKKEERRKDKYDLLKQQMMT